MANYVYTMNRVGKIVPPKKQILKDISLSFFPGAKIGVLGANGAGKSTLLRIMAGDDTNFMGTARPAKGIDIGYFRQEIRCHQCDRQSRPLRRRGSRALFGCEFHGRSGRGLASLAGSVHPRKERELANLNRDLQRSQREFREDLYFRISTFRLRIQPLKDRPGDIVPLVAQSLARAAAQYD